MEGKTMPRKANEFRVRKDSKPVLERVSVKMLLTPSDSEMFNVYAEKTEVDKTTIASKALISFIRGDGHFKSLLKRSPKLQERIENASPSVKDEKAKGKAKPKAKAKGRPKGKAKAKKPVSFTPAPSAL